MADKIVVRIILEVLGAPKSHVEKTMGLVIEKLGAEDGIKLLKKETYKAEQQENGLWSTFSEIEFETGGMQRVMDICFDYMPSTVEILEPAGMEVDCNVLAEIFNDLLAKLHRYDMLLKNFNMENKLLKEKMEKMRQDNLALIQKLKG